MSNRNSDLGIASRARPVPKSDGFATDLAWNDTGALDRLSDRVTTIRWSSFCALQAELLTLHPRACDQSGFLADATDIVALPEASRLSLVNHPIFRIWMQRVIREMNLLYIGESKDPASLLDLLTGFSGAVGRIHLLMKRKTNPTFHREDIDPLIAGVLAPSYVPPQGEENCQAALEKGHRLSFFTEVAAIALDRIGACMPAARHLYDALVGMIFYLPDGDFRSCSASRYGGIVLLSARDPTILDLEESLVHEAGHQLLYAMAEVAPVTEYGKEREYSLPWSTQVREIYGYYHAFFIYVLLARYHERAALRDGPDALRAIDRLRHILRGLKAATPVLDSNPDVTQAGQATLDQLKVEIAGLAERHPTLVA